MSDEIIDLTAQAEVVEVAAPEQVVESDQALEVLELGNTETIIESAGTLELIDETASAVLLEVSVQGPPGASGSTESSPVMTYTSGVLTRVDYASGNFKVLAYTSGVLTQIDYTKGAVTTRKTLNYNPDGSLASVTETVL